MGWLGLEETLLAFFPTAAGFPETLFSCGRPLAFQARLLPTSVPFVLLSPIW